MDIIGTFAYMGEPKTLLVALLAALVAFGVGGLWYAPKVFGAYWMSEMGMDMSDHKAGSAKWVGMAKMYALTLVQAILLVVVLGQVATAPTGALLGVLVAMGFVATMIGVNNIAERRTLKFFMINAGYAVLSFAIMGAMIGQLL